MYYLWVYYSNFIIYHSILLSYYNNIDQVTIQSGFKIDGEITRKVIIYFEYNLDVVYFELLLYYLWDYYSNFIIYYSILLSYYNNRDQEWMTSKSGFKTIWDITRKVIIYSGYYYIFVELLLLYY